MTTGAVALLHGWADPMALLRLPPEDWPIAVALVEKAQALADERRADELRHLAESTANQTINGVAKIVRNALRSFRS